MDNTVYQADLDKILSLFKEILAEQAPEALALIEKKRDDIISQKSDSAYFITFSVLPQKVHNKEATYNQKDLKTAADIRKNWDLSKWSLDQVARTYLLLLVARYRPADFNITLDKIISAADAHELITLYQAFQLFPNPEQLLLHATNGIRCNMISAFNAIALNNPYPADYFNEIAWNQLVVKTLFVDSPVDQIQGLQRRANLPLTHMLINTVLERSAANRPIRPEIWYLIGLTNEKEIVNILKTFLEGKNEILQQGALLSCERCQLAEAKQLIKEHAAKYENKAVQDNIKQMHAFEKSLIN